MPTEEHDAIQRSLREQHPDWSETRVRETTYRILVSRGWRPQSANKQSGFKGETTKRLSKWQPTGTYDKMYERVSRSDTGHERMTKFKQRRYDVNEYRRVSELSPDLIPPPTPPLKSPGIRRRHVYRQHSRQ